jgi:hypothetical protein
LGNAKRTKNNGEATNLYNCVVLTYMIRKCVSLFVRTDATVRSVITDNLSVTLISAEKDRSLVFIYLF